MKLCLLACALFLPAVMTAQDQPSVADAARQSSAHASTTTPARVYTDDDLSGQTNSPEGAKPASRSNVDDARFDAQGLRFRNQILAIKQRIANLQSQSQAAQTRKLRRERNYSNAATLNREEYEAAFNRAEAQDEAQLQYLRQQIASAGAALTALQEKARRAGYGNAVYEP